MREIGQNSTQNGRYRCAICGAEIQVQAGDIFPACPAKDHSPRWVLGEERVLAVAGSAR